MNSRGEIVREREEVCSLISSHFANLFTSSNPSLSSIKIFLDFNCNKISLLDSENLIKEVSSEKILTSVKSMKPWKSPGLDGFQGGFF